MAVENELKMKKVNLDKEPNEMVSLGGRHYLREPDGTWRYGDTGVKVPGARDMTLEELFKPKVILSDGEVERVIVAGRDVVANPKLLGWCLEEGTRLDGADGSYEVLVPVERWEEHNRISGAMVAPEYGNDPAERDLAEAERQYREADQALAAAAARRAEVLRRHAGVITRQRASEITDLSVGRVHQLIRESEEHPPLKSVEVAILGALESQKPVSAKALRLRVAEERDEPYLPEHISRRLRDLRDRELVSKTNSGYEITAAGHAALIAARANRRRLELGDEE